MTNEPEEELYILQDLAKIKDIKDFRLGDFMREHGMNPSQPTIFYGALIKACRDNEFLIKYIDKEAISDSKRIAQLKADVIWKDNEIKRLKIKVNSLLARIELKGEGIDKETQELKATASQFQERIDKLEQERDMALAKIEKLQAEIVELQAKNVKLEKLNKVVGELYYGLRQRGWVDKSLDEETTKEGVEPSPDEAEEPQENNDAMIQARFYKLLHRLSDLADKRSNETIEGG